VLAQVSDNSLSHGAAGRRCQGRWPRSIRGPPPHAAARRAGHAGAASAK